MGNTQINSKSPGRWHYIARLALCLQNPSTYHTNDKSGSVLRLLLGIWAEPAQLQAVIMAIAVCLDEVWPCPAQDPQFCAVRGSCCASASGQPARWDAGLLNHAESKIRGMAETPQTIYCIYHSLNSRRSCSGLISIAEWLKHIQAP